LLRHFSIFELTSIRIYEPQHIYAHDQADLLVRSVLRKLRCDEVVLVAVPSMVVKAAFRVGDRFTAGRVARRTHRGFGRGRTDCARVAEDAGRGRHDDQRQPACPLTAARPLKERVSRDQAAAL
jgi:hypothetical protein